MRSIIYVLILLILVAGIIIPSTITIKSMAREMSAVLETAIKEEGGDGVERCMAVWEIYLPSLHFLIDHSEIDKISAGIAKMRQYSELGAKEDLAVEAAGLKVFIEHIPERERLTLKNIF